MKKVLLLTVFAALAGCTPPTPEEYSQARAVNDGSASNPRVVAKLADGRPVLQIRIVNPGNSYDHFVYIVDGAQVSTNYNVPVGKSSYNQTIVTLPPSPSAEQVILEANRLQEAQREHEEAEYKRLKEKFGD